MTDWLHQSFHRMRSLFRRAQLDRDLDANGRGALLPRTVSR